MKNLNLKKILAFLALIFAGISAGILFGETEEQHIGIGILVLVGGLWIIELIPLTITAMLVPVFTYFTNIFDANEALSHFSNPIIYVFVGGFTLAAVLSEHDLDKWLARKVLMLSKGKVWNAIIYFLMATSFLSMWMSNTATTAMFLPIGMSLVDKKYPKARVFVILGTAYAANIGGLATLIGSPPNLIAAAALNIDFVTWVSFGLPFTVIFFPILLFVLKLLIKPEKNFELNGSFEKVQKWNGKTYKAVFFFFSVVLLWILSRPISELLNVKSFDSIVAIIATAFAPILGLTTWKKLEKQINWGILFLFGGGLCLSAMLSTTGTSELIAKSILGNFTGANGLLLILVATAFMVFLTEISSNTGAAAILVPIMMEVATQFDPVYVFPVVLAIGISANCAFMLPVATPPNALAYSTNEVSMKQMVKIGLMLNIVAVPFVWLVVSRNLFNIF